MDVGKLQQPLRTGGTIDGPWWKLVDEDLSIYAGRPKKPAKSGDEGDGGDG